MKHVTRRRAAAAAVALTVLAAGLLLLPGSASAGGGDPRLTPYQRILRAEVANPDGSPRKGRDPAVQRQTSLAAAASRPNAGPGGRVRTPAAGLPGRTVRRPAPSPAAGTVVAGCATGYGTPGDQCLPLRAPGNRPMTCTYVVRLFPAGIAVTGKDTLGLDGNRDKVACGPGDRDVPQAAHEH